MNSIVAFYAGNFSIKYFTSAIFSGDVLFANGPFPLRSMGGVKFSLLFLSTLSIRPADT
jgi:hypothetical protein